MNNIFYIGTRMKPEKPWKAVAHKKILLKFLNESVDLRIDDMNGGFMHEIFFANSDESIICFPDLPPTNPANP